MTAKQLSYCFYGLQNLFSQHEDVKALISALSEKASFCKDSMSGPQLGMTLYSLQGMDDSVPEVRNLIAAITEIAKSVESLDAASMGNAFFGLQRMSTNYPEMCDLLSVLAPLVLSFAEKNMSEFSPQVCANIIYGLQNCSCTEESVRNILYLVTSRVKELVSSFFPTNGASKVLGNSGSSKLIQPASRFADVLSLYQSLTLSLLNLPNLDIDAELRDSLLEQQSILSRVVESRKHEYKQNITLTVAENRLVDGITALLSTEPYVVQSSELLWGFESAVIVKLDPRIHLTTLSNEVWTPVLNLEVLGSSHTFPAKDLFTRLRNRFLVEQKGINVEMLHSSLFVGQSQTRNDIIASLRSSSHEHVLNCLYPPTIDDANNFASILFSMGITGPNGLMTTIHSQSNFGDANRDRRAGKIYYTVH
jgi:hypothetical protein